jgi:DNA-binding NarL/FixJ family response regulator
MNQLKVNEQQAIVALAARGWSRRRIARELGIDRKRPVECLRPES